MTIDEKRSFVLDVLKASAKALSPFHITNEFVIGFDDVKIMTPHSYGDLHHPDPFGLEAQFKIIFDKNSLEYYHSDLQCVKSDIFKNWSYRLFGNMADYDDNELIMYRFMPARLFIGQAFKDCIAFAFRQFFNIEVSSLEEAQVLFTLMK